MDSLTAACTYLAQGCALFNHIGRLGREQPLQRLDDAATCAEGLSELVVAQCDVCERSSGDLSRGIRTVDESHTSTGHVGRHRIAQRLSAASLPPSLVWPQPARSAYGSLACRVKLRQCVAQRFHCDRPDHGADLLPKLRAATEERK
jgi:hypothetical protein